MSLNASEYFPGVEAAAGIGGGTKNALINGDMLVSQRGASFAAITDGAYSLDRWEYQKSGAMVHTITQEADAPGTQFTQSLKIDCTTAEASPGAGDYCFKSQKIEGYNFLKFVGKEAMLSFWVKSTKTGIMGVSFQNDGTDRTYVVDVSILAPNVWEKKTVAITFDYTGGTWDFTNGMGLRVAFCLAAGSTYQVSADSWLSSDGLATSSQTNFCDNAANDVFITGVQLELGNNATDFDFLDYSANLARCQRYYEVWGPREINNADIYNQFRTNGNVHSYNEVKRVPPAITLLGLVDNPTVAAHFYAIYENEWWLTAQVTPPSIAASTSANVSGALFDAEL